MKKKNTGPDLKNPDQQFFPNQAHIQAISSSQELIILHQVGKNCGFFNNSLFLGQHFFMHQSLCIQEDQIAKQ